MTELWVQGEFAYIRLAETPREGDKIVLRTHAGGYKILLVEQISRHFVPGREMSDAFEQKLVRAYCKAIT